jgi:REP-associated tyrosine transposase
VTYLTNDWWPHAPIHRLGERGTYVVTAGTYRKLHHFSNDVRLGVLERGLVSVCKDAGWRMEAWAVFSNHYHFVAHSPETEDSAVSLKGMLAKLHFETATWVNKLDGTPRRRVWHNYWETLLTFERSYLARLAYVHQNAVKHGLVVNATDYPWCSARWFEQSAPSSMVATLRRFKVDSVRVYDDFDVVTAE